MAFYGRIVLLLLHRPKFVIRPISNKFVCEPTYISVIPYHKTHPPFFIASRILLYRKLVFLYLNRRYLPILDRFLLVDESNMNRFSNGFHPRKALGKLYNIAAQSFSRHKLRCMKIIIESFLGCIRFPCVSSVVFEAITISISRDVLSC